MVFDFLWSESEHLPFGKHLEYLEKFVFHNTFNYWQKQKQKSLLKTWKYILKCCLQVRHDILPPEGAGDTAKNPHPKPALEIFRDQAQEVFLSQQNLLPNTPVNDTI